MSDENVVVNDEWVDESVREPEKAERLPQTRFGAYMFFNPKGHFDTNGKLTIPAARNALTNEDLEVQKWAIGGDKHILIQLSLAEPKDKDAFVVVKVIAFSDKKYAKILAGVKNTFGDAGLPYGKRLELQVDEHQRLGKNRDGEDTWYPDFFVPVAVFPNVESRTAASTAFWEARKSNQNTGTGATSVAQALRNVGIEVPAVWANDETWYTEESGGLPALMTALGEIVGESVAITPPMRAKVAALEETYGATPAECAAIWARREAYNAVPKF